jgi:uncharacterized glyoxalase superfamily protein PhnB
MLSNRSIPRCTVIPELAYPSIREATEWLSRAFGFTLRIGIGDHRAQLNVGDGAVALIELPPHREVSQCHGVLVRVEDAKAHCERARKAGANIIRELADYSFGERQYTVQDPWGHHWTFSQSIADVAPEQWGGTSGQL